MVVRSPSKFGILAGFLLAFPLFGFTLNLISMLTSVTCIFDMTYQLIHLRNDF